VLGYDFAVTGRFVFFQLLAPTAQYEAVEVDECLAELRIRFDSVREIFLEQLDGLFTGVPILERIGIPQPSTLLYRSVVHVLQFAVATVTSDIDIDVVALTVADESFGIARM
jgi:hypothetical protein